LFIRAAQADNPHFVPAHGEDERVDFVVERPNPGKTRLSICMPRTIDNHSARPIKGTRLVKAYAVIDAIQPIFSFIPFVIHFIIIYTLILPVKAAFARSRAFASRFRHGAKRVITIQHKRRPERHCRRFRRNRTKPIARHLLSHHRR
jgi:hypothetical protein